MRFFLINLAYLHTICMRIIYVTQNTLDFISLNTSLLLVSASRPAGFS